MAAYLDVYLVVNIQAVAHFTDEPRRENKPFLVLFGYYFFISEAEGGVHHRGITKEFLFINKVLLGAGYAYGCDN